MSTDQERPLRVLSLGAGVQSTTVYLMSLHGELPPFDHVIFSDTGWEPKEVYEHLERLKAAALAAGAAITVVSAGNIRSDHVGQPEHLRIKSPRTHPEKAGKQRSFMPFFIIGDAPEKKGKMMRTCTSTYKIEPVEKEIRRVLGLRPGQRWPTSHVVDQSLGISWDETQRIRQSRRPAIELCYPLIDRKMTRDDCHEWMAGHGWTAPRSACIGCPFHRNEEWRRMRDDDPVSWADAIEFDETIRLLVREGKMAMDSLPYLHDSRVPLSEADIDLRPRAGAEDRGLRLFDTMFGGECEGLCGT